MRIWGISAALLLGIVDLGWSQVEVQSSQTSALPMFRPVLLGSGPDSLINRIDTAGLIKSGQKDAAIMFNCSVRKDGTVGSVSTYRGTPNSRLLEEELLKKLSVATNPRFIPAICNHLPVDAMYYGTVTFVVIDGKPRLRIFSNQERPELQKESDFIGPQPFWGGDSKFTGFRYPSSDTAPVPVDGSAELELKVDDKGVLRELRVVREQPPFLGFGQAAFDALSKARFIPAFRDGKPVASVVTIPVYFNAPLF